MRFIMLVLVLAICDWSFCFVLMRRFLVSVCHPGRLITSNETPVDANNCNNTNLLLIMCARLSQKIGLHDLTNRTRFETS